MADGGPRALAHPEHLRLDPRALEPIQAGVQDLNARGQLRQSRQLVLREDQLLQLGQQGEGIGIDGGDAVAREINPLQFC